MFLTKGHTALSEVHKPAHILQHKFCTAGLMPGSPREISPGGMGMETDTGPPYFLGPLSKLVVFVCIELRI